MFTKLTDTTKAAIFSVLVLVMAVGAALLINTLGLASTLLMWATVWSITPTVAALIMLLVVTREGYSKEGWKSLGLHRLGLNVWWIAFGGTLLITVAASAVVWATPLALFVIPEGGILNALINFLIIDHVDPVLASAGALGILLRTCAERFLARYATSCSNPVRQIPGSRIVGLPRESTIIEYNISDGRSESYGPANTQGQALCAP